MNKILAGLSILALAAGSWACGSSGDDDDPPGPGPGIPVASQGALVCAEARQALDAMQTEGPSSHAAGLVETLLDDLNGLNAEDADVLYAASYVGDAYRGGSAEAVGTTLANMVQTCGQAGYSVREQHGWRYAPRRQSEPTATLRA
jgi:hypothetical protein